MGVYLSNKNLQSVAGIAAAGAVAVGVLHLHAYAAEKRARKPPPFMTKGEYYKRAGLVVSIVIVGSAVASIGGGGFGGFKDFLIGLLITAAFGGLVVLIWGNLWWSHNTAGIAFWSQTRAAGYTDAHTLAIIAGVSPAIYTSAALYNDRAARGATQPYQLYAPWSPTDPVELGPKVPEYASSSLPWRIGDFLNASGTIVWVQQLPNTPDTADVWIKDYGGALIHTHISEPFGLGAQSSIHVSGSMIGQSDWSGKPVAELRIKGWEELDDGTPGF